MSEFEDIAIQTSRMNHLETSEAGKKKKKKKKVTKMRERFKWKKKKVIAVLKKKKKKNKKKKIREKKRRKKKKKEPECQWTVGQFQVSQNTCICSPENRELQQKKNLKKY